MKNQTRYITVKECGIYEELVKKYNIVGYSSPSCTLSFHKEDRIDINESDKLSSKQDISRKKNVY